MNVSSTFALAADQGSAAYTAAKSAIIGLTRACAVDYAHHNIRTNGVCPGGIITEGVDKTSEQAPSGDYWKYYTDGAFSTFDRPLRYTDDESSWVTGVTIPVDGGEAAILAGCVIRNLTPTGAY